MQNFKFKKSVKIPKGQSEAIHRKTDNTMVYRHGTEGQT